LTILHNIHVAMDMDNVLRRQGLRKGQNREKILDLTQELLKQVEELHLLEPAVTYDIYKVTSISHQQICFDNGTGLHGSSLPNLFPEIKEMVVAVGTIGPKLEEEVTVYLEQGQQLKGILLDGIGSAAVDCLMQEFCNAMEIEASSLGYQSGSHVSPGMPGLPITEQWTVLKLANASQIGVSLTVSGMMIPRKSNSIVIGWGPRMLKWTKSEVCERCSLSETCHYRIRD